VVGHFQHAVGEAPFVVEPDEEVDQVRAGGAGLAAIDDGRMRVVIEIDRGVRRLGIGDQSGQRACRIGEQG
jgi:D-serine deaminase-like pyridoxal phosphate-dependent protein